MSKTSMKRCPRCDTKKPLTAFAANNARRDGLNDWCRDCAAAHYAQRRAVVVERSRGGSDGNQGIARWLSSVTAEQHAITQRTIDDRTALPAGVRPVQVPVELADLLGPAAGWRARANCSGLDPGLFYPEKSATAQLAAARAVCDGCVVRAQCLTWALEQPEEFGVWAGTSERQRRRMRTALPRWARCSRCGGRFVKSASRQRFCGVGCRSVAVRRRAS